MSKKICSFKGEALIFESNLTLFKVFLTAAAQLFTYGIN